MSGGLARQARADERRGVAICPAEDSERAQRLSRLGFLRDPARDVDPGPGVRLMAFALAR